jgi:hypothetical protein
VTSFAYPPLLSPLEHARDNLPPVLRTDPFFGYVQALIYPFARVDAELAEYVSGIAYPETATGEALAARASWVDEPRGGMDEFEWRRIVLGARSARNARRSWTDATALAMVEALFGDVSPTIRTAGAGSISIRARLRWTPTPEWIRRAEGVLRKGVKVGLMWEAIAYPEGAFIFDGLPGLDAGALSWYLSGEAV